MADREILERLDAHMARGNELMAQITELHRDQRQFTRDVLRRNEIVMRDLSREIHDGFAVIHDDLGAQREVLSDMHGESQAQRQAILALIDELRTHGLGGRG